MPADWRTWSSFSGVILSPEEYAALDAARRSALRAWVALGGQLYLSPLAKSGNGDSQSSEIEKLGAGSIVTFSQPVGTLGTGESLGLSAATLSPSGGGRGGGGPVVASGPPGGPLGRGARGGRVGTPSTITTENAALVKDLTLFAGTPALPDRGALLLETGALFDAIKEEVLDNGWLAVFLVLFAMIVGPVNLFVFAPADKRHRLFVTTPIIALVAALGLGVTILMQDGTGGHGA